MLASDVSYHNATVCTLKRLRRCVYRQMNDTYIYRSLKAITRCWMVFSKHQTVWRRCFATNGCIREKFTETLKGFIVQIMRLQLYNRDIKRINLIQIIFDDNFVWEFRIRRDFRQRIDTHHFLNKIKIYLLQTVIIISAKW